MSVEPKPTHIRGEILSHTDMCAAEKRNLQQGMNFRQPGRRTVVL